jgi:hypothetical protein
MPKTKYKHNEIYLMSRKGEDKQENEEIDILFNDLLERKLEYPLKQEREVLLEEYEKKKVRSKSGYTKFLQPNQKRDFIQDMINIFIQYLDDED